MIPFDKYLVWQCGSCGKWQGKINLKWSPGMTDRSREYAIEKMVLNCLKCRKQTKLRDNRKGGLRVKQHWCQHPNQAKLIIQEMERLGYHGKMTIQ